MCVFQFPLFKLFQDLLFRNMRFSGENYIFTIFHIQPHFLELGFLQIVKGNCPIDFQTLSKSLPFKYSVLFSVMENRATSSTSVVRLERCLKFCLQINLFEICQTSLCSLQEPVRNRNKHFRICVLFFSVPSFNPWRNCNFFFIIFKDLNI